MQTIENLLDLFLQKRSIEVDLHKFAPIFLICMTCFCKSITRTINQSGVQDCWRESIKIQSLSFSGSLGCQSQQSLTSLLICSLAWGDLRSSWDYCIQ